MKKLFINKKELNTIEIFKWFLVAIPLGIFWNLWLSLIFWTKPEPGEMVKTVVFSVIPLVLGFVYFSFRKSIKSIDYDLENNNLIITHLKPFGSLEATTLEIDGLAVSELKYAMFTYFFIEDRENRIKISSSTFGMNGQNVKKIRKSLVTILAAKRYPYIQEQ